MVAGLSPGASGSQFLRTFLDSCCNSEAGERKVNRAGCRIESVSEHSLAQKMTLFDWRIYANATGVGCAERNVDDKWWPTSFEIIINVFLLAGDKYS